MPDNRSRYILLCQQGLACAVVLSVAASAAGVVSLDIVAPNADAPGATGAAPSTAGRPALVAGAPARATVREVPLAGVDPAGLEELPGRSGGPGRSAATRSGQEPVAVLSGPQAVGGFATVGATWARAEAGADVTVAVRTRTDGRWSDWQAVSHDADHGPDPDSAEAASSRAGTDPVVVGDVDEVQLRAATPDGAVPEDMRLALVDPGTTAVLPEAAELPAEGAAGTAGSADGTDAAAALSAGAARATAEQVTARPAIYSRRQWGADERMRDKGSLSYGEVHAGFVHHTVNANAYSRRDVPAILRGIYAYHTLSRGWSDVGYNFLVDRFGRIWEGRAGGVAKPVVGAHTLGYNESSFAMSAIGNFDIARPRKRMLRAYGRLLAWKLAIHGINASARRRQVGSATFRAVNGHRDAGSTACPGRYLYSELDRIRRIAKRRQRPFAGRDLDTNLVGKGYGDLLVRDATTGKGYVVRMRGPVGVPGRRSTRLVDARMNLSQADLLLNVGDWNGDGRGDVMTRNRETGGMSLRAGRGRGRFGRPVEAGRGWSRMSLIAAVGDVNGDGHPDLIARRRSGDLRIYPSNGATGFRRSYVAHSRISANRHVGGGLWNRDGAPDSIMRSSDGSVWLWPGNGPGGLMDPTRIGTDAQRYDWFKGVGDLDADGRPDILVRGKRNGKLYLLPGNGGSLGKRRLVAAGYERFDLAG